MTGAGRVTALVTCWVLVAPSVVQAGNPRAVNRCTEAAVSGQQLRAKGSLRAAAERFAICIARDCPGVVRRDCGRWLGEIEDAMPSIVFRVLDGHGHDMREGQISFDGERLVDGLDGRAVAVDPGAHRITYTNGPQRLDQDVVVREGERNRSVLLRFPSLEPPAFRELPPPPPPAPPAPLSPWPWILGGGGLTALGVGTGFWFAGTSAHSDLESTCAPTHSCTDGDVSSAKTQLLVGDILIGIGVAAIAGAVTWLVTRRSNQPEPRSTAVR